MNRPWLKKATENSVLSRKSRRRYPQWFIDELVNDKDKQRAMDLSLSSRDKVEFLCSKHGSYFQLVGSHIKLSTGERQKGCPKCAQEIRVLKGNSKEARKKAGESYSKTINSRRGNYPQWFIDILAYDSDKEKARNGDLKSTDKVGFKCDKHGVYYQLVSDRIRLSDGALVSHGCPKCVVGNYRSRYEEEIFDYLKSLGIPDLRNNVRDIISNDNRMLELDIYSPSFKIAIEVNGSYYHSTPTFYSTRISDRPKSSKYHYLKFSKCAQSGIHLISVFDVDWLNNKDKIKSYFRRLFVGCSRRFFARKLRVSRIEPKVSHEFCSKYHILGKSNLGCYCYGLYYNDELLVVMEFYTAMNKWYMTRYCVKDDVIVVGGASKLLKAFELEKKPRILVTYSDNDYFTGDVYSKLGFTYVLDSNPRYYWYLNDSTVFKREQCKLSELQKRYPDVYNHYKDIKGNVEDAIMSSLKFCKVYRSGNKKWVKNYGM